MDFNTGDIVYFGTRNAEFSSNALYYGLHGGIGYAWDINEKTSLDVSGKVIWLHQRGDDVNVHGDAVHFENADSIRTRLGGRVAYKANEKLTPYAGLYWEHEYDGKVRSTVNGVRIEAPELKGSTGVGELGLSYKPTNIKGLSVDVWLRGYVGQRKGATGNVQLRYRF